MKLNTWRHIAVILLLATTHAACLGEGAIVNEPSDDTPDQPALSVTEAVRLAFANVLPAGIVAVQGAPDYSSTSLSLLNLEGGIAAEDFLNSGSTVPGLSTAIGSDVVAPSSPSPNSEIVVIDRGNAVLTWIDHQTRDVIGQMVVGEAFYGHNPQDYLALSPTKAYVARGGVVFGSGSDFTGDDLLIINPSTRTELGSIGLSDLAQQSPGTTSTNYAAPYRVIKVGDYVYVVLQNLTADGSFLAATASLAIIDPSDDSVVGDLVLTGLENCGDAIYSIPNSEVTVVCSGNFAKGPDLQLERSGLAIIDASNPAAPTLKKVIAATSFAPKPLADDLGYVGVSKVAVVSYGETDFATGNVIQTENVYVVDTSASTDIANEIYNADGAFQLTVFADPVSQRLYVGDGAFAGPLLAVFETDRLSGAVTRLDDIVFDNDFPVRDLSIY